MRLDNILFGNRLPETRPPRAGVKFRIRTKYRYITADAAEYPALVEIPSAPRISSFGSGMARYFIGNRGEFLLSFRV